MVSVKIICRKGNLSGDFVCLDEMLSSKARKAIHLERNQFSRFSDILGGGCLKNDPEPRGIWSRVSYHRLHINASDPIVCSRPLFRSCGVAAPTWENYGQVSKKKTQWSVLVLLRVWRRFCLRSRRGRRNDLRRQVPNVLGQPQFQSEEAHTAVSRRYLPKRFGFEGSTHRDSAEDPRALVRLTKSQHPHHRGYP